VKTNQVIMRSWEGRIGGRRRLVSDVTSQISRVVSSFIGGNISPIRRVRDCDCKAPYKDKN